MAYKKKTTAKKPAKKKAPAKKSALKSSVPAPTQPQSSAPRKSMPSTTEKEIRDEFDCRVVETISVRGRRQPVTIYVVK